MENSSSGNGVSVKAYLETIITRVEDSVKEQVADLRNDIKHMQADMQGKYITRAEHDLTISFIRGESERIDRDWKIKLNELSDAHDQSVVKYIALATLGSGLMMGLIQLVLSFVS